MILFFEIFITALLATHFTYLLSHRTQHGTVRVSSGLTLLFILLTLPFHFLLLPQLQAAFFGGSFVGMSDSKRLGERAVLFASALFSVFFVVLGQCNLGLGGLLGTAAFLACLISMWLIRLKGGRIP